MTNEELAARHNEAVDRLGNLFMHLMNANTQNGSLDTRRFHLDQARYEHEIMISILDRVMDSIG